jgi:hypothetical protein
MDVDKLSKPHLFCSITLINVNGQTSACLVNSVADILHHSAVNETFFSLNRAASFMLAALPPIKAMHPHL